MCQGPIVFDEVLPAIISVVLVEIPLEWRQLNHGVSCHLQGLGDERMREGCIELVGDDIQIVPLDPQPAESSH